MPRHINPDHYLETPTGRVYTAERNAAAWVQAHAELERTLATTMPGTTLYLVIGLQGAGKTAWIERQAATLDERACFFDAALPGARHRQPLLDIARRHGVPVVAVWLDTPLSVALARNRRRRADHQVPEASIRAVHEHFEAPRVDEGYAQVWVVPAAANKACPVLVRQRERLEVLAFRHPLAGLQLVKGSIEPGEASGAAALRELAEEAGILDARLGADLGTWLSEHPGQDWAFHLCHSPRELPDAWTHHCDDDGGLDFAFFWHALDATPGPQWHPLFRDALGWLRERATLLSPLGNEA